MRQGVIVICASIAQGLTWSCAGQVLGAAALLLLKAACCSAFPRAHATIALHALNTVCLRLAQCPQGPTPPPDYASPADAANMLSVPGGSAAADRAGLPVDSQGVQADDASVTPCTPPAPYGSSTQPPPPMVRHSCAC
jgi:hypothetical protein